MKLAAVSYHINRLPDWAALSAKITGLLADANADLVILPEYAAMEAALIDAPHGGTPLEWRDRAADVADQWVATLSAAAKAQACWLLAGSGPVNTDHGVVNRAWLIAPDGQISHQDKMILTPYERDKMDMIPGDTLFLHDTPLGKIGILICYDSEFPLQARALCEAGADMILVPAATDFAAGQTRVRQSCRARAIENQCLIAHAPLVGTVDGCDIVDQSNGRAGIFCPPDHGLPSDGILANGPDNAHGFARIDVDPAAIAAPRTTGQVGNFSHWVEQDHRINSITLRSISPITP